MVANIFFIREGLALTN